MKILYTIFILLFAGNIMAQSAPPTYLFSGNNNIILKDYIVTKSGNQLILAESASDSVFINNKREFINKGKNDIFGHPLQDVFFVNYDKTGNLVFKKQLWAQGLKPNLSDVGRVYGFKITEDHSGNFYITGRFHADTLHFGNLEFYVKGDCNLFIIKMNPSGQVEWHKIIPLARFYNDFGQIKDVAVDDNNNLIVSGNYLDTIRLDSTVLLPVTGANIDANTFVASISADDGQVLWAKRFGGEDMDDIRSLIFNHGNGLIYLTGYSLSNNFAFGSDTIWKNAIANKMYISALDKKGTLIWAKYAKSPGKMWSKIKTDDKGNVYILGNYQAKIEFGDSLVLNDKSNNFFLAKYNEHGAPIWVKTGKGFLNTRDLAIDNYENIYFTGNFLSDTFQIGNVTFLNKGFNDIIISNFKTDGSFVSALHFGAESDESPSNLITDENSKTIYLAGSFNSPMLAIENHTFIRGSNFVNVFVAPVSGFAGSSGMFPTEIPLPNIIIYPNPSTSDVNIQFSKATPNAKEIVLFDVTGREVRKYNNISGDNFILQRDGLQKGLYLLQIRNLSGSIQQAKVVFE